MSKQVLLGLTCVAALMAMPLLYANDAPVVDVTQQAQTQAAKPDDSNLTPSDDSSDTPLVTSVTPSNPPAASAPSDNYDGPISTSKNGRVAKLEQQVRNLVRMNLPDQITQLRQQVEKLRGQVQVQTHTIETLKQRLAQKKSANKDSEPVQDVKPDQDQKSAPPAKADDSAAAPAQSTDQAPTPPPVKKSSDEAGVYRNAFNMLIKKQYAPAGEAFENYLKQYPQGQFLVNAHYWLGEIYLLQKKSSLALEQFQAVVDQFPHSSKVSDSKLKIAQILAQTGKVKEARALLTTIIKKYPGSTAAQLAKIQLQQLNPPKKSREE